MLPKQVHIHENYIIAKHRLLLGGLVTQRAPEVHVQNNLSELQQSEEDAHSSLVVPSENCLDELRIHVHSNLPRISKTISVHLFEF